MRHETQSFSHIPAFNSFWFYLKPCKQGYILKIGIIEECHYNAFFREKCHSICVGECYLLFVNAIISLTTICLENWITIQINSWKFNKFKSWRWRFPLVCKGNDFVMYHKDIYRFANFLKKESNQFKINIALKNLETSIPP